MRQYDLAPLYRNTVGFDRLFSMLDQFVGVDAAPSYPPYNIERTGENAYRISVAVAGFTDRDLTIEVKENTLSVRGEKQNSEERKSDVLYQGIAARTFERRFQLADGVQVVRRCGPRERPAPCGPRPRDPGGQEAEADPDRERRRPDDRGQEGRLNLPPPREKRAPRFVRGAFLLCETWSLKSRGGLEDTPFGQRSRRDQSGENAARLRQSLP
jgi:molecular chaperone IbpA